LPTYALDAAKDAVTTFTRDKLDRLTAVTDAMGYSETYDLNAFGQQVRVKNKLDGVTTKTYDHRGLLVREYLPITSRQTDGTDKVVSNKYDYDSRGNLTKTYAAFGLNEEVVTTYEYDLLNRQKTKIGEAFVATHSYNLGTTKLTDGEPAGLISPTERTKYDLRGNIIEFRDAKDAITRNYYDNQNRKKAQLVETYFEGGRKGALTTWTYDAAGNVASETTHAGFVDMPETETEPRTEPTAPAGASVTTVYRYDGANRRIEAKVKNVTTASPGVTGFEIKTEDLVTSYVYDVMGNLVQETDARGVPKYTYYDRLGRKIGEVDPLGYMTFNTLDAEGNVLKEERFATAVMGATKTSVAATLAASVRNLSADDRTTVFTYYKNGWRWTEARQNVVTRAVNATTNVMDSADTSGTSIITYTYNGLGLILTRTEATGTDKTEYGYDAMGRQTAKVDPWMNAETFESQIGTVNYRRQRTETTYDGLGHVTKTWVGAMDTTGRLDRPATDHVTTYTYGDGELLMSVTDAEGAVHSYGYDPNGRMVADKYVRTEAGGFQRYEAINNRYDRSGRLAYQLTQTYDGSSTIWTAQEGTLVRYDGRGQMTGRGRGAALSSTNLQEKMDYDAGGRMWRSNSGDGVTKV